VLTGNLLYHVVLAVLWIAVHLAVDMAFKIVPRVCLKWGSFCGEILFLAVKKPNELKDEIFVIGSLVAD